MDWPLGISHAVFLHLYQERHARHPELGSFEPGVGQPGGSRRYFRHRDRIERRVVRRCPASSCGLRAAEAAGGLSGLTWGNFLLCQGLGAGIGVDCWGAAQPAVRYDSPTWGGFRFEASYGKNQLTGAVCLGRHDTDFWDVAVFYTADWNSIKLSAAAAYTWIETGVVTGDEVDLFQVGASIMHKPSGLGIYGMYQWESTDGCRRRLGTWRPDICRLPSQSIFQRVVRQSGINITFDLFRWRRRRYFKTTRTPMPGTSSLSGGRPGGR